MIFGSGGVMALVVGLWGGLWAWRHAHGRYPAWSAEVAAFLGGALAPALLNASTLLSNGLVSWAREAPEHRAEALAEVLASAGRPLVGFAVGAAVLLVGVIAGQHAPRLEPERPPAPPWSVLDRALVATSGLLATVGLGLWSTGRAEVTIAATELSTAVEAAPSVQQGTLWMVVLTAALALTTIALGIRRSLTARQPGPGASVGG